MLSLVVTGENANGIKLVVKKLYGLSLAKGSTYAQIKVMPLNFGGGDLKICYYDSQYNREKKNMKP